MPPIAAKETKTPQQTMIDILGGLWLSRAVYVAAELGVADHIGEQPRHIMDLARATGAHVPSLYRIMRALASADIFREHEGPSFSHTAISATLRSDVPGSMRYTAISELGTDHYSAWEHVLHSVRTGETAFDKHFGMPVWRYYRSNPEISVTFERSMTGITQSIHEAIDSAYSFKGFRCILDIGGAEGALLKLALAQNPRARGILFDRPDVLAASHASLAASGMDDRCAAVGGDFFEAVPTGADLHLLKWILHDWTDVQARQILQNCRRSLVPGGKLVLIETILPEANEGLFPKLMDLNMMVMTGGRERSQQDFASLLQSAGFRLTRVLPTQSPVSILEAELA